MIEQFLRELYCPRNICDPPVKLAINEIRAAPEEQSEWRGHNQIVAQIHPRDFVAARVVKREQQQGQHTAVARHAAFPNAQDRQRLPHHFPLLEKKQTQGPPPYPPPHSPPPAQNPS